MEWWTRVRVRMAQGAVSKRQLCREEGIGWGTLAKVLAHSEPPGYRRTAPYPEPKLGPYVARIEQILDEDSRVDKKQRHTAQRIFDRLVAEGYTGGYTQVREKVRKLKRQRGEVFVPLRHDPCPQPRLVIGHHPISSLRRPGLTQHLAGTSLRHRLRPQHLAHMRHRGPALRRAQKFPEAASRRIERSSA